MIRLLFSLVLLVNFSFSASITIEDLNKYQQYKEVLENGDLGQKESKNIKTQEITNNISASKETIQKDISKYHLKKENIEKNTTNLFKYDYNQVELQRYGKSFFQNKNILDKAVIPTSNNYILNNGDTLFINTYGAKSNKTYELTIDNNGNINIPNIGLLKLATLSFNEAKIIITNSITKAFPNTKVILDITGYSSIQVVVTGNVKVPGIYNLTSFSTIKDALITANGLLDVGSYRDIDLIRDGKKIFSFDLYKLLDNSATQKDIMLKASDIIVVNFVNKTIKLSGKVKYQAIYDLKDDETFEDLMRYSGGFSFDATKDSIKLTRYDDNKNLKTYIINKNKFFTMKPKDGDTIEVFNNYDIKEKPYILVHGKVIKDNKVKYTYFDNMNVKDLSKIVTFRSELIKKDVDINKDPIEEREALFVDKNMVKIIRNNDDKKRIFTVSLEDNFKLKPFDDVEFFNYFDTHPRVEVTIEGEVVKSGKYFIDQNTTLNDLIKIAGGLNQKAYIYQYELIRYTVIDGVRFRGIEKRSLKDDMKNNFPIKSFDQIKIFTIPNWSDQRTITLKGEVLFPGKYIVTKGEKLSDVINRAGGFTDDAFIKGALFTRESIKLNEEKRMKESMSKLKQQISFISTNGREAGAQTTNPNDLISTINILDQQMKEYKALGRLIIYLDKDMEKFKKSQFNIRVEDKDSLIIPSYNDTISVYGEVLNPNSFVYNNTLTSLDYLEKAGGFSQRADDESIYIVEANGESKRIENGYFFGIEDIKVSQGSTIIVPMKIDRVSNVLLWKEVSQIIYQLAITAASLNTVGAI